MQYPEKAVFPWVAFKIASWYWSQNADLINSNQEPRKGNFNELVDGTWLNFTLLTHSLTPDLSKLKERANLNDLVLNELEYVPLMRGQGVECQIGADVGYAVPVCLSDFKRPYCGCQGKFETRSCPYGLTGGGKCRSSSTIKCCIEKKNSNHMDMVNI